MEENNTVSPDNTSEATVTNENGDTVSTTNYEYGGKTFTSVDALGKSYTELQSMVSKKLGGFEGSPENYALPEGTESNSYIESLQKWGADNQLSQKGFEGLLESYNSIQQAEKQAQEEAYKKAESEYIENLGENAQERVQNAKDWINANLPEFAESATPMDTLLIEKVMKLTKQSTPATQQSAQVVDAEKVKAMRFAKDENGNRLMSVDPNYRAKVLAAEEQLRGA